ncbi:MAG: hypothetical protein Kow0037_09520 [Calditrichia bacterium]
MAEAENGVKRLYRSREQRFLGGVCGGLGEYFQADPNLFRILFLVFTFVGGVGLLLYIASLLIVPENPDQQEAASKQNQDKTMFWAILFIVLGTVLLFKQFGLFDFFHYWDIPWSVIWALFLIGIGVFLIFSVNKKPAKPADEIEAETVSEPADAITTIKRKTSDKMLAGVCAGIADYFNLDPSLVRILWVLATLTSVGLGILVYILLIFVFPAESETSGEAL